MYGSANITVFSPTSSPYGVSYPEWTAKWWQWFISIPLDGNHPHQDAKGTNCERDQAGPVWFLPGSSTGSAERTCTIPQGKAILFPTINNECSTAEDNTLTSDSLLRDCAVPNADDFRGYEATIDGVPVKEMDKYNVVSPPFNVTFPPQPVFTADVGPSQAVSAGNWVFLGPLSAGSHDIQFKGESVDYTAPATNNFAQDVKYHLIVP